MESSIRQSSTRKVEEAKQNTNLRNQRFVFSAYRLCLKKANELGKEIGILNVGETRADKLSKFKFETQCGSALRRLARQILKTNGMHEDKTNLSHCT